MKEQEKPILEEANFKFTQDSNCLGDSDDFETIEINVRSSLGIDRDDGVFYELKTDLWSINSDADLRELFDRIGKSIKKDNDNGSK